ncbi:MAG: hypothetical protein H6Q71_247 [Firmicutes bacterium]|jgi:hypothetical protein|nr:hypothetical protein [Bacillota bacterium]
MKLHFSPLRRRRIKRFFKRLPMDTGLDWEMAAHYQEKPVAGI